MSRPNTLLCSITSAVKRNRGTRGIATKQAPLKLEHLEQAHRSIRHTRVSCTRQSAEHNEDLLGLEGAFMGAFAVASTCQEHKRRLPQSSSLNRDASSIREQHKRVKRDGLSLRKFGTRATSQRPEISKYDVSKDELKQLVDYYDFFQDAPEPISNDLPENAPEPQSILLDEEPKGKSLNTFHLIREGPLMSYRIHGLRKLLRDPFTSHAEVFKAYQKLPSPRAACLGSILLDKLLHHLSVVEHKDEIGMLRFLTVIDDAKAAGKTINLAHWNSAISFTGRWLARVTASEVEAALYLWKEMEREAGVKSDHVTFNILFDIAAKAGKFALAESILKEMQLRNLKHDRYFRTGLIYYYGLKGDGDGVRTAYREMVDMGSVVDSAVVTCVIGALLKCGEAVAAEHVFGKMKNLHAAKSSSLLPPSDWRAARELGKILNLAFLRHDTHPEETVELQETTPIAPKLSTYQVLIYYYAVSVGDIDRVMQLINEMDFYDIPLKGRILLFLFKGFGFHGGEPYTSWTLNRLESLWTIYNEGLDKNNGLVFMSRAAAELIIKAYSKCSDFERTQEIWKELQSRWAYVNDERTYIEDLLAWLYPLRYFPREEREVNVNSLQSIGELKDPYGL